MLWKAPTQKLETNRAGGEGGGAGGEGGGGGAAIGRQMRVKKKWQQRFFGLAHGVLRYYASDPGNFSGSAAADTSTPTSASAGGADASGQQLLQPKGEVELRGAAVQLMAPADAPNHRCHCVRVGRGDRVLVMQVGLGLGVWV